METANGDEGAAGNVLLQGEGSDRHLMLPLLAGVPGLAHAFTVAGSEPEAVLYGIAGRRIPLWTLRQVHGRVVRRIDDAGPDPWTSSPPEGDALLTTRRGAALGVHVADCVPVLLCDPRRGLLGAVHAGWRGTVAGVVRAAIESMVEAGTRADDLHVGLGPAIGPCCFTVGPDVLDVFRRSDPEADRSIIEGRPARINLVDANRRQALACGVRPGRIASAGLCTFCRPDMLESHRRSRGRAGRMTALIAWTR